MSILRDSKHKSTYYYNVLNFISDNRSINSNTKTNNTRLILLNANLLCCTWVREKMNSALTSLF